MPTKKNIYLIQVNYQYGKNVFVPYSVGSLQAYAQTILEIRENFEFLEPIFLRKDPVKIIKEMNNPSVVGFSSYIWNWEYNKVLAKLIKIIFPKCLIVFGGTQVPDVSDGFFLKHPYVDILVHHEGELSFTNILLESLSAQPNYSKILGLSIQGEEGQTFKTNPAVRIKDLSKLPSPYLSGVFDFVLDNGFLLNVSQETNRGCPYSCTFCDWGGNTYNKLFLFEEDRILEELDWFGTQKAEYVFNCDANYGILDRDSLFIEKMIKIREKHKGFPRKFRMCTAKKSNDKIFEIAKVLNAVGMSKGATLSFQSMDELTLTKVKRNNIRIEQFSSLMDKYWKADIPTYTELIIGMPGETYESTKKGIDILFNAQADAVNIHAYVCGILPNSEMNQPVYIHTNEIKSSCIPILLAHSTPEPKSFIEYNEIIIETELMSHKDWQRTYLFYWVIQAFHCLGLVPCIAILIHKEFGISYSDFYEKLINHFTKEKQTLVGREITLIKNIVARVIEGGRLDLVLPKFGDIYWPLEEASFLNFIIDKERFYKEIKSFIKILVEDFGYITDSVLFDDIVLYQSSIIKDPYNSQLTIDLQYDLHGYFNDLRDLTTILKKIPSKLKIKSEKDFGGDLKSFAREVVWYGRKGGRFHHTNITEVKAKQVIRL